MNARRWLVLLVYATVLGAGVLFATTYPLDELAARDRDLRALIDTRPVASFLVGLAVYFAASLVPGTAGKSLVAGWFFGFAPGVAMVLIGLVLAALLSFGIARAFLRQFVEARFGGLVNMFNRALERDGAFWLVTVQLTSFPYWIINYVCGASRVRVWTFLWTMVVGTLPGTLILVYTGSQLPTLEALATHGVVELLDPALLWLFALMPLAPLATRLALRAGAALQRRLTQRGFHRAGSTKASPCKS